MGDPRLNSVHLDPARRQDFRRARQELLHARGGDTLCAEAADPPDGSPTCIVNAGDAAPPDAVCWLSDREFTYPLKVGLNTLGRSADNDVVVEELFISRRHLAILVHHDGSCELHDLSSKNGTHVNGRRVSGTAPLRSGDEIRICDRPLRFRTLSGPAAGTSRTQILSD